MEKKRIYKVTFETAFDKEEKKDTVFMCELSTYWRSVKIIADDIEGALAYARKHFIELASEIELKENEHVVDIIEVSLDPAEVYA